MNPTPVSRGRLRSDDRAVRFVEVVVNGPKSWSLAAALHPDIAAAYDAAWDRAAEQIIAWLSQHATTRVGPRGGQVQVPLQVVEAVTVRHYTSRHGMTTVLAACALGAAVAGPATVRTLRPVAPAAPTLRASRRLSTDRSTGPSPGEV